ncbi:hypothetical protein IT407_04900 [Candidatus Uhrbacteria bacterium]|nr:hypothetical protein [Candidatus Uhrbacteria bacterium]
MLPLEQYQLDILLEEKAGMLECMLGPFIKNDGDSGAYDTDTGRAMGVNAGHPEWYSVSTLLTVNTKKHIVKIRYSVSDDTEAWIDPGDWDDGEIITPEDYEEICKTDILYFQANNPDQLRLPFPPTQSALRFPHPLDEPIPPIPMAIDYPTEYFHIIIRYSAVTNSWSIKWEGSLRIDLAQERKLLVPLGLLNSGDKIEEDFALNYVRDFLKIIERERFRP